MKSELVDAPLFDELPMALECKLISYDEKSFRLVGEIVNVCADEKILDENGRILSRVIHTKTRPSQNPAQNVSADEIPECRVVQTSHRNACGTEHSCTDICGDF